MKIFLKVLCVVAFVTGLSACETKRYTVKGYIEDKERTDQELSGNSGYLMGQGAPIAERKKTRKVFVLETTKRPDEVTEIKEESTTTIKEGAATQAPETVETPASSSVTEPARLNIPKIETIMPTESQTQLASLADGESLQYTVEKDDTLQKISKKFYNSYSKWMKIYEANKDIIKNPDILQPGLTIRIPKE